MSSTPAIPPPAVLPGNAESEREVRDASVENEAEEATAAEIEEEVDVVSKINDPANDDVFEHLRPKKD